MAKQKRPNVIFLLTDDQRYGTIHALGNKEIKTPNLDKLVKMGTSFMNAYIPGGTTSAVCMPSRAMINSGKTLFHLYECGKDIPKKDVTMGQAFLGDGYNCFETGKWHNGTESFARSFNCGENIFFAGMWDHWNVPVSDYRPDGNYDNVINFTPNFSGNQVPIQVIADRIHAGVHSTDLFSRTAIKFIEEYDKKEPFFMYVSFLAPHDPRTMPEKYKNMYNPDDISLPENFQEMPSFSYGWNTGGRDETTEAYPRRPEKIKKHIADYYAMISHIDWQVGNIINALKKKGILEDTIIVFCGDNGLAVGQHGLMGKQNIYEHGVKIPLIMAGPGIPKNERRDQFVYLLDVYPTLCDLCGVKIPKTVDGQSFAKVFADPEAEARTDMYYAFQARIRAVRSGRYKLIEYRSEQLKLTQLFDIEADPWEKNNMYQCAGYEQITEDLRKKMFKFRDEWEDEKNEFGAIFWKQYRQYEDAAIRGVKGPKGTSMQNQMADTSYKQKK